MAAAGGGAGGDGFEWPWQYNFPPFFTVQPNEETRAKQVAAWGDLICDFCRHKSMEVLVVAEAAATLPLFNNAELKRSMSHQDIVTVVDALQDVKPRRFEWLDDAKARCLVLWTPAEEWAKLLAKWIEDTGQNGEVCTLYEIREGDAVGGARFKGIGLETLRRAIRVLEGQGKAVLMPGEDADSEGVKFL